MLDTMRPDLPSTAVLEAYLKVRAERGGRMPSRLAAPLEHWEYGVGEVDEDVPFAALFRRHRVFLLCCHSPFLLNDAVLPSGGGLGYFAFDGRTVTYLHAAELAQLEAMLAADGPWLFAGAPELVAEFFATTLLAPKSNHRHRILASHAALSQQHGLVAERFAQLSEQITAPSVRVLGDAGWEVAFYSLYGWMHRRTTLRHELVRISSSFRITCEGRDVAHDLIVPLDIVY